MVCLGLEVSGDASQLLHRQHALAPRLWTMRGCPASAKTPRHPSCSGSAMPRCDCTSRWIRWYRLYRLLNGAVMHVTTTSAIAHSRMPQNAFCNPACFRTRCGETKVPWRGSHMPTQPTLRHSRRRRSRCTLTTVRRFHRLRSVSYRFRTDTEHHHAMCVVSVSMCSASVRALCPTSKRGCWDERLHMPGASSGASECVLRNVAVRVVLVCGVVPTQVFGPLQVSSSQPSSI